MAASKRRLSAVSKHLASTEVESTVPVDSYLPADQECAQPELLSAHCANCWLLCAPRRRR